MIVERKLELLIFQEIFKSYSENSDYRTFLDKNYNVSKMTNRYLELGKEFLNDYAIDKTEKSD